MSAESEAALEEAAGYYRATGDAAALQEAAQSHLAASRELETVLGEYTALQQAAAAGEPYDADEYAALGQELTYTRMARAFTEGNLPGTGHSASAGIGT